MDQDKGVFEAELLARLPRLRRFCRSLAGTAHDADDLAQATIERLLIKRPPADADLTKWMFRVCKNIWIDEMRSRKVRSTTAFDEMTSDAASGGERDMLAALTIREVNEAMARLPDVQRVIISLVAVEGYTYKETAEILGMPIGTVMSRLSRARSALAAEFDQQQTRH